MSPAHSLWYKDAIFYEVSPRAFKDGNGDAARNERGSIAEMRAYLATGIDGFFTDDPGLGRKALLG